MSGDAVWCPVPQCVTRTNDIHDHLFGDHDHEEVADAVINLLTAGPIHRTTLEMPDE